MSIKIYTKDSKYYMEDLDRNTTTELTNPRFDKGSGKNWFDLPDNSIGQKAICKEMIDAKGEVTRGERTARTINPTKSTKTPKLNLDEYYTDEEREQIKKLQSKIDKINEAVAERAKKDIGLKALAEQIKNLDPEALKALMATIEVKA